MEKVRPWCGQPSDRGRLRNRTPIHCWSRSLRSWLVRCCPGGAVVPGVHWPALLPDTDECWRTWGVDCRWRIDWCRRRRGWYRLSTLPCNTPSSTISPLINPCQHQWRTQLEYKGIYTPQIAKIGLNNWCRICCEFSKCQHVVVNVHQCTLLMGMLHPHNDIFNTDIIGCDRLKFS